jgi:hypothetical protein
MKLQYALFEVSALCLSTTLPMKNALCNKEKPSQQDNITFINGVADDLLGVLLQRLGLPAGILLRRALAQMFLDVR